MERPKQVRQVFDVLKNQGPIQTYRAVKKKLDAYTPLGYSCTGEILEVGRNVNNFKKGDIVACAGVGYANHAEIVSVPVPLVRIVKCSFDLVPSNTWSLIFHEPKFTLPVPDVVKVRSAFEGALIVLPIIARSPFALLTT